MNELDVNLNDLSKSFSDETSARQFLARLRWPDGPRCPHCGSEKAYRLVANAASKRPVRAGVCKCAQCRKQFTVTVGTIFEDSHIPLSKWLLAIHLLCASKKGMSAHQLHRMLDVTYKSAWFMAHRIRYAMTQPPLKRLLGAGGVVEADETYIGGRTRGHDWRVKKQKVPVVALAERSGEARAMALDRVTERTSALFCASMFPPRRVSTPTTQTSTRLRAHDSWIIRPCATQKRNTCAARFTRIPLRGSSQSSSAESTASTTT